MSLIALVKLFRTGLGRVWTSLKFSGEGADDFLKSDSMSICGRSIESNEFVMGSWFTLLPATFESPILFARHFDSLNHYILLSY
jgi:hypothetical protein